MTAAVARLGTDADHPILDSYAPFRHDAGVGDRGIRDRLRHARAFLAAHPDLAAWMARPVTARLVDLDRDRAWLLIVWAVFSGRVAIDMDLLAAKHLFGLRRTVETLWPDDLAAAREVGARLGWSPKWTRDVIEETACVVMAITGRRLRELTDDDLEGFLDSLAENRAASAATRKHWHSRMFGVRQVLYELGVIAAPPRRRMPSGSLADRFAAVAAPEIRRVMIAYVNARSAVLSRSSVEGLVNALAPFGEFLTARHPEVGSLRQLERAHIEAFLVWNRTRFWRGRLARDKQVSASVVHAGVLALRNLLDDITLWGWAERPERRLVFATDVPRLPRPLPRGLAPDIDAALLHEVARLDDVFARVGIILLRRAGLRLGDLLDLELGCVVDYGPTGTWLRVPLGKLWTERSVPLDASTESRWPVNRVDVRHGAPADQGHQGSGVAGGRAGDGVQADRGRPGPLAGRQRPAPRRPRPGRRRVPQRCPRGTRQRDRGSGVNPVRDDTATVTCPVCTVAFTPDGRQRHCSTTCRQRAWRQRRATPVQPLVTRSDTVYACPNCDARYLGVQRCDDCNTWCRRLGPGGTCPCCDEPIAISDLFDANQLAAPRTGGDPPENEPSYFDLKKAVEHRRWTARSGWCWGWLAASSGRSVGRPACRSFTR